MGRPYHEVSNNVWQFIYLLKSAYLYHDIRDGAWPSHETRDIRDPKESLLLQDYITAVYSLMLFDIDLLTLSLGVGLNLPPFINPVSGQIGKPCPGISKKVWHLYISLLEFEMALLTLFLGVGLK